MTHRRLSFFFAALVAATVACGAGQENKARDTTSTPAAASTVPGSPMTPKAGRRVIVVEMSTDDRGVNKFTPNDVQAESGDVLRFTLVAGVHNVDFVADSNRAVQAPAPAPMLQAPGQTFDVAVDWPRGRYYFQCDPHALLGMTGHVAVK
jgi:plastocyanin